MTRESRPWLIAAGVVSVAVIGAVLVFGLRSVPEFPSLYSVDAPRIEATVAYLEYDRDTCLNLLDVSSGQVDPVICDQWIWIEGWDEKGHLVVQRDGAWERQSVVNPETGAITESDGLDVAYPGEDAGLRAQSWEGSATLTNVLPDTNVTLIEVDGPRDYAFWSYGRSGDWVWAVDSENRLLVVAADGSSGPWLVRDDVRDVAWR